MSNGENVEEETSLYGFKFRTPDKRRVETRKYDIQQLWQRSHEILNLALLGHKQTEIAALLNIHPQTVSNTLNSTLGKGDLAEKRETRDEEYETLREDVLELTKKALEVYHEIFDEPDESGRVSIKMKKETADTVALELAGMRAPTRIDSRSMHMSVTADEVEEFKKRGFEAAKASGHIIDVVDEGKRKENK